MELYILDKNINIVGLISVYNSILWSRDLYKQGNIKITMPFDKDIYSGIERGCMIYKPDEVDPCLISGIMLSLSKDGRQTMTIKGCTAGQYLNQRIVDGVMNFDDTPANIMRCLVESQIISPEIPERKIKSIRLGHAPKLSQDNIQMQVARKNLQESITAIAEMYGLGWNMRLDIQEKTLYFDIFTGTDRTLGTKQPCVFSTDFNNIISQDYEYSWKNYKSVIVVERKGDEDGSMIERVGAGTGTDRYEIYYNQSGSTKDLTESQIREQIREAGFQKLSTYAESRSFESNIDIGNAMHYELGDYVTCYNPKWNLTVNTQITGIEKSFSQNGQTTVLKFGKSPMTLINLIKAKE